MSKQKGHSGSGGVMKIKGEGRKPSATRPPMSEYGYAKGGMVKTDSCYAAGGHIEDEQKHEASKAYKPHPGMGSASEVNHGKNKSKPAKVYKKGGKVTLGDNDKGAHADKSEIGLSRKGGSKEYKDSKKKPKYKGPSGKDGNVEEDQEND